MLYKKPNNLKYTTMAIYIDENIYNKIVDLKNNINGSVKSIFILGTKFENRKELQSQAKNILDILDKRITDIRLYLQKINS